MLRLSDSPPALTEVITSAVPSTAALANASLKSDIKIFYYQDSKSGKCYLNV